MALTRIHYMKKGYIVGKRNNPNLTAKGEQVKKPIKIHNYSRDISGMKKNLCQVVPIGSYERWLICALTEERSLTSWINRACDAVAAEQITRMDERELEELTR